MADVLRALGRTDDARAAADEALEISRSCGYRQYEADALACRAAIATADGDDAEAEDLAHQALRIAREISDRIGSVDCLEQLAAIAARQESYKESARILAAAAAEHGLVGLRAFQLRVAAVARTQGPQRFSSDVLTNPSGFAGIDGLFRFRADGTNERGLAVMRVGSGGGAPVAGSPKSRCRRSQW